MASTSSTGPLKHDRKVRIRLCNINNRLNSLNGPRLKGDVFDSQCLNIFISNFNRRHTSSDGQTLNRDTVGAKLTNKRDLPCHCTRINVDQVNRYAAACRYVFLNLG